MKKVMISSVLLLAGVYAEAQFATPFGAKIRGAGSIGAAPYMSTLINQYNKHFPCPQVRYFQTPTSLFTGLPSVERVFDNSVIFAVSDDLLPTSVVNGSPDPSCLLQIPFIATSLSIIYHLPGDFLPVLGWPGHLNISPMDLCTIYTNSIGITWGALLGRPYNGSQIYAGQSVGDDVNSLSLLVSDNTTGIFVKYLACANPNASGTCATFLTAAANNPNGPFCSGVPPVWSTDVSCVTTSDVLAESIKSMGAFIGYVPTGVACAHGFIPGNHGGVPLGVAGLFVEGSTTFTSPQQTPYDNPANYVQPSASTVSYAVTNTVNADCTAAELCVPGAYPIVYSEFFVLNTTQTANLTTCNIAQFIEYALTEGQKLNVCGFVPLTCDCAIESLTQLDQVNTLVCQPCVEPCNPCLNQPCPIPCVPCCAS